ncbi:hypothetical protein PSTG_09804 [Puccinia striiformis f. sp. tritici PST-78]|uniref:Uncharacterized protein n=1 Tax=Puccinia striiformis f. sp. tritici PST-78 TaxID=1165861 RepID=A0A0L0VCC4_9BASI|nr:hypothetical protein PSTG_09804 [Puccinia striiformis f. sp. tritici PST-78]
MPKKGVDLHPRLQLRRRWRSAPLSWPGASPGRRNMLQRPGEAPGYRNSYSYQLELLQFVGELFRRPRVSPVCRGDIPTAWRGYSLLESNSDMLEPLQLVRNKLEPLQLVRKQFRQAGASPAPGASPACREAIPTSWSISSLSGKRSDGGIGQPPPSPLWYTES